ncbi:hybrid polyketide nonribosomal peptide synthetase [Diaporthe amygdali]|uniref:hybrid polyketide nonribosomal peptide synthetase n=1 Tax=Phomopsis amygdali TaxID=1214568 RepID=UPI0022FED16D|nr:hybrid polyketide nonribosomal peptide synthetase [Diaporthe amygdali]KAJ0108640.1 hybrid polyketide nonribosomal peptide synthetase [Diaporthe amygdali]
MEPIAIIGLAHRFPGGANTPAKLWEVLNSRRDLSREPDQDRLNLQKFYNTNGEHHGSSNVTKSYFLEEDPRLFDTTFFNVSPLEAEAMDPQQRLLLETVYEATESAGTPMEKLQGSRCSVFVGVMTGDYETIQYRDTEDLSHYTASGTSRAILANRISYFFDLSGSSICLDTACSSSLVAMHLAVQDLRSGTAETAIVAGTNLIFGPDMYISESKLRMLSPTGKCQMWDAMADGYARGEGVAALLLKPLSKALRDNDPIQAIIRNSGVNSDGRTPGITMPSAMAQAKLTRETYRAAGLDPSKTQDRCQYFEAHGTGTQAGDPTEARGIFESFFSTRNAADTESSSLYVGSIKTVVGHLEGCAGLAGVIKVLLAMKHDTIPPNLHLTSLNPKIQPYRRVLKVPTEATPWPARESGQPKRASVNSFGFGGTNAHIILESHEPKSESKLLTSRNCSDQIFATPIVVSAHTQTSLFENIWQLTTYLHNNPHVSLDDVAWTLWQRRSELGLRKSFHATSRPSLLASLEKAVVDSAGGLPSLGTTVSTLTSPSEGFGVLGVFTGQGAQWPGMGKDLLIHSPVFRKTIEECDECLSKLPDAPSWLLKEELVAEASQSRISEAEIAQPATTAVEIGLVRMLQTSGIKFSAVVGHSSGEIAALYAAGILSLADAIRIAFYRGLYAKLAGKGSMMAVGISGEAAQEFCRERPFKGRVWLAAKNSPSSVTLSGEVDAIQEAKEAFDNRKIFARVLKTDKAYHSPSMDACSEAYLQAMRKCGIKPQRTSKCIWVSSVDGNADRYWDQNLDEISGPYWIANMVKPVLFTDAITTALTNGGPFDVAIEVGPHPALKGPVNQTVRPHLGKQLPYCGSMNRGEDCVVSMIQLQGFLWSNFGATVLDFDGYQRCWQDKIPTPKVVDDLPTYFWDHGKPIWRESRLSRNHRLRSRGNESILLGHRCLDDSDWEPRWRNFLNLKELPWLRGHSFQGEVLFPSAGYVAMMLEVAQFLSSDKPMSLVDIKNLALERPLKVEEGPRPVEMLTSAKVTHKDDANITAEFSTYMSSDANGGKVERTCFGTISVSLGSFDDDLLPPRVDPLAATVPPVDIERFYSSVKETRLEYEDLFKRLNSMRRVDGIATATASWFADEIEYGNLYHPALIDVALQPVFAAFNAPTAERLWTAYLPQSFEKITVNPRQRLIPSASGQIEVLIDAFSTEISATKISGDVSIYSTHDNFNLPFLQLEGMALAALGRPDASNDRTLFAETKWEADLLEGDEFEVDFNPPQDVAVEESERVALFFCRKLLAEASAVGLENLKPHEKMMFEQLTTLANTVEKGSYRDWANDTRETINAILERNQHQVDFELLRLVGDEAGSVFRNEKQMVQVLFADDKLSHFYREGLGLRNAQRQISAYLSAISHRYPKANILEIGAGTGASTAAVFDTIGDHFGSYTFTDVSLAFFPEAQNRFAAHVHKMTFKKLDIGQSFEEQGFDTPSYDVIIAANVLHVSDDIGAVLRRVRGLLKPGGFLVVTEPTSDHLRIQVIMGGLEGWWLARDNCRRFGPVATIETWDEKLRGVGFTGVDLFSHDQKEDELHTFTSFVSQAADPHINALREPLDNTHMLPGFIPFTVIGGSTVTTSKIVRSVRNRLSSFGNDVVYFPDVRSIKSSDLPVQSLVLCLSELDQPTFKNGVDESVLSGFKGIIEKARGVLILTKNASTSNPYSNMLIGLCRGLRAEMPALGSFLQVMDIDGTTKLDANIILQRFLQLTLMAVHNASADGRLWSLETEISLKNSQLFIPRIQEYEDPNERTNSARREIVKDVTSDTHIIEVNPTGTVVEVKARSKIISERAGLDTINNTFSCLTPINLLPFQGPQYLCVGTRQQNLEPVVVLSATNSSTLQISTDRIFPAAIDISVIALMSVVLAAQAWVRSVPRDHTIWLHDVDSSMRAVIEVEAKKNGIEIFATSTDPTSDGFIPLRAPKRMLKAVVPRKTAAFIFGDSISDVDGSEILSKVSSFILVHKPSSGRFWDCPTTRSDTRATQLLEEAYISTVELAGSLNPGEIAKVVPIGEAIEVGANAPASVVDWRQAQSIPIRADLQPVKPEQLFKSDKTYFMVGLTGDVGISICSWMIKHGVQYVVLASRNPKVSQTWIHSMSKLGAKIRVIAMDVTNPVRIREAIDEIFKTMPPISGVCNGSMVLSDKLFMQMDVESMETALQPKIDGSINLDRAFAGQDLDFFIMLSSTGSVIGTPGQSNYHMANTFMAGLAADRRRRGLAGSVIDVGMISDTGYVTRQDPIVAKKLRSMCVLALCESEVHIMFAEGILAGRPGSASHSELIAGLAISNNEAERPFWANEPRFGFYVRDKRDLATESIGPSVIEDLRAVLESATDEETIFTKVREAFAQRLESLLQLPPGSAKMDLPLVSLGLDSLLAMEVQTWFRKVVGTQVSVLQVLSGASGDSICRAASAPMLDNKSSGPVTTEIPKADSQPEAKTTQLSIPAAGTDGASTPIRPDNRTTPGTPTASSPTPMTSVGTESRDGQRDDYFGERKIQQVVHRRAQMSFAQARLWFLQGFLEDPTTYNETSMYELHGILDVDRLENAFRQLTWHHEILRTYFYADPATGLPMQAVTATSACPFKFVDSATDKTLAQEYGDMKARKWKLEEGVCLGLTVLRHSPGRHTLILSSHHIAIDGVTWILLLKDLARAYEGKPLPTIPQYVDFSVKQRSMVEHGSFAKEIQFWKDELAGLPDELPLFPMSHTKIRKATNKYVTTIVDMVLPKKLVSRVKQVSSQLHVTPFHFHFAVLASMVSRLSQTNDFCIGTVDTGRSGTEFSQTAGCFINIVPVRVNVAESDSFEALCKMSSSKILASLTNSTIPLDALLDELQVTRTARHSPIFQVIINYRLGILGLNSIGDAELKYVQSQSSGNPYDLGLNITDTPDGTCLLHFAVQEALYSKEAAQTILDCYRRLLESACEAPQSEVAELTMYQLPVSNKFGKLSGKGLKGRGCRHTDGFTGTLSRQIDQIAENHPDLIAIKDGAKVYTYQEMMRRIDSVAAVLRAKGVPRGTEPFCCLLYEPSADYVFAYLAVLKVGAIVVSLDPTNHQERLASIVGDCNPQAILHHQETSKLAQWLSESSSGVLNLETSSILSQGGESGSFNSSSLKTPAVLFYTSGTTGVPKGAILRHENYTNLIEASSRSLNVRPKQEVILQQTGVNFDLCPFEIFIALLNTGTVVMASKDQRRDPSAIVNLIKEEGVTIMAGTPVEFKHIFQHAPGTLKDCEKFRTVIVGGEIFTPQLAAQFKQAMPPDANVFNVYGPTETCIFATFERVKYLEHGLEVVPVGSAIDNVSIYVVDEMMNLVPDGCAGEVCIGGAGVSQGYLHRPELTSHSFIPDPFATVEDQGQGWKTMYRTGDSGYLKADGSLVILGRTSGDSQVKIRGIRIELEDIASNILKAANGKLAEAVVTVRGEDKTLVAFAVIASGSQIKDADEYLRSLPASLPLPDYMRPSIIIPLEQLPINHNGKLDRAALNKITIPIQDEADGQEMVTPLERDLGLVWEKVLPDTIVRSTGIHPNSDFFRLGGNSLLLVNLRKIIQKKWLISVSLLQLFEASTLRSMAAMIRGAKESRNDGIDWEFWDEQTRFDIDAAIDGVGTASPHVVPKTNKTVMLVGAAKGLGAWLLKMLLDDDSVGKIHCVALAQEQANTLPESDKLMLHVGSLGELHLGLSDETQQAFKRDVDIIIHAGADGSCLNNYDSIRIQNVESTKFLTNLALARKVPFHYISSPRVILFSGGNSYPERPISSHYPPAALGREGFTSTKWASETFLENCSAATDLPVSIHRAGYLMSEDADEMDAVNMIHKYSAILKAVPSLATFSGFLDMCKLPTTAEAILKSFTEDNFGVSYGATRIIHHTEDNVVPVHEFQTYMEARFGDPFKSLSMVDWATEAEKKGMSPVLAAFLEAVVERGDEARYPRLLRGREQDSA